MFLAFAKGPITAGYLRASLREVDEAASRPGAPDLPCRTFQAVPIVGPVRYRIPLVANARRFKLDHHVRLFIAGDDQDPNTPAMLTFRHASVGTSCLNVVRSSSRLLLPVVPGEPTALDTVSRGCRGLEAERVVQPRRSAVPFLGSAAYPASLEERRVHCEHANDVTGPGG
jgi:hypothetical protein